MRASKLSLFFRGSVLAVLVSLPAYPQDKPQNPKVVLDLEKPTPTNNSQILEKFGKTCDPFNQKVGKSGPPEPTSIAELMGGPIEVVKIRSYGPGWKNPEDVQNLITKLLKTQTAEVYTYEP